MSSLELSQVYKTPDGAEFTNKQDALNHMRRPKISEAMLKISGANAGLVDWLLDNQESVENAFDVGTIRRVTKADAKKLAASLAALVEVAKGNPKLSFLAENAGAVQDSFRWPAVKRMDEAEKATAARNSLLASTEGNEQMTGWIILNKDAIMAAYEAGVEKRQVNDKATQALAEYRARMAAERVEMEAAEKEGPDAVEALKAKRAAAKQAAIQAAAQAAS